MRYLVKINELKQKIDYLDEELAVIYDNIDKLEKTKTSIIWQGDAAIKFNNQYDAYIKDLKKVAKNILSIIEYLLAYCDKYGDEYNKLRKKYSGLFNEEVYNGENSL